MSAKYTPGPWETGAGYERANLSLYVCEEAGGDIVAEVVSGNVADRDLIAAAPDLLEALRKVSAALEAVYESEMEWTGEWDMLPPDALEMAKAAIRKAEGK